MDCLEFVGLSNIVISLSAAGATCIAGWGLKSWKDQKIWEIDHELARRVLMNLYLYSDAIKNVRHPFILTEEMSAPLESKGKMKIEHIPFLRSKMLYENRLKNLHNVRTNIYVDLNEATAIWGPTIAEKFKPLFRLQTHLESHIRMYSSSIDPDIPDDKREKYHELLDGRPDILSYFPEEGNTFTSQFISAMENLEEDLRSRLGRRV